MARLMEHVWLPLLAPQYVVQRVEEEALVKNSNACKDYLVEAMKQHLLPTEPHMLIKSMWTLLRTPQTFPNRWWWSVARLQRLSTSRTATTSMSKDGTRWQCCLAGDAEQG